LKEKEDLEFTHENQTQKMKKELQIAKDGLQECQESKEEAK
jgi:hypothetical protein